VTIQQLAYLKWQEAGEPSGNGHDFWIAAEHEIISGIVEIIKTRISLSRGDQLAITNQLKRLLN